MRRRAKNESGFTSDVSETGLEVRGIRSSLWDTSTELCLSNTVEPVKSFHDVQIVAAGGYIRPEQPIDVTVSIGSVKREFSLSADMWNPIGAHDYSYLKNIEVTIFSNSDITVETVGLQVGQLDNELFTEGITYDNGKTAQDIFEARTYGCVPYIYYFNHFCTRLGDGGVVMAKSCNRCGRYLPVERVSSRERQSASFSNHSNMTTVKLPSGESAELTHGYQLECKACKKFYVNAPLNHQRSSSQRREDSLRRREIEDLVAEYSDTSNPFTSFREQNGDELDEHVWEIFDRECFKCGKGLESVEDMHLDHTMPLAYLWPLDETATCLCPTCNSAKSDSFPCEFYNQDELEELSEVTGISMDTLQSKQCNPEVIKELPPIDELDVSDVARESLKRRNVSKIESYK